MVHKLLYPIKQIQPPLKAQHSNQKDGIIFRLCLTVNGTMETTTALHRHPITVVYSKILKFYVIALTSPPFPQCSCKAGSDGSDMLLAVPRAKSSVTSSTRKRGGQLWTWLTVLKEDRVRMRDPNVYGLRRWSREWLSLGITWMQDRQT